MHFRMMREVEDGDGGELPTRKKKWQHKRSAMKCEKL